MKPCFAVFVPTNQVIETSRKFLDESILGYTTASGILPLRKRIAQVSRLMLDAESSVYRGESLVEPLSCERLLHSIILTRLLCFSLSSFSIRP